MKIVGIKEKLAQLGVDINTVPLGDFDTLGEFTAKRQRSPQDALYSKVGAFYRSNYERGILIYYLITTGKLSSFLEIGFGRGYATLCAAKAFRDTGKVGRIVTIDPGLKKEQVDQLAQIFPRELFEGITFMVDRSEVALPKIDEKFDLIYIDGDHSYEATKRDWEMCSTKWKRHVLFDDYHLPTKKEAAIECARAIDEIADDSKELIRMDRRIFLDERGYTDDQVDYGQVLLTKPADEAIAAENPDFINDWLKG